MTVVIGIALLLSLFFYVPKCIEFKTHPINIFLVLPAIGIFAYLGSYFFMGAFENPSGLFVAATIINIVLFIIHVIIHTQKYGMLFSIIHYFIQAIIAVIIIFTIGLALWLLLLGLNIFCDGVSDFFDDIFDDRD